MLIGKCYKFIETNLRMLSNAVNILSSIDILTIYMIARMRKLTLNHETSSLNKHFKNTYTIKPKIYAVYLKFVIMAAFGKPVVPEV